MSNHRSFSLLLPFQIILGGTEDIEDIRFDNDSVITDIMLVGVAKLDKYRDARLELSHLTPPFGRCSKKLTVLCYRNIMFAKRSYVQSYSS